MSEISIIYTKRQWQQSVEYVIIIQSRDMSRYIFRMAIKNYAKIAC